MKDVAILTKYYRNYNFGGMLQGYALHNVIEKMGFSCDIISYDTEKNTNPIYKNILLQSRQYGIKEIINKIKEKVIEKLSFFAKDSLKKRIKKFEDFYNWANYGTRHLYSDNDLQELNQNYRIFLSGSDQIWNPNAVRRMYLQTFVTNNEKKISYAASIGRNTLSKNELKIMLPELSKFNKISVREKSAAKILNKYLGKEIKVVLDPTMLIKVDEWNNIAAGRLYNKPYALFYFFSDSLQIRKILNDYCSAKGLNIVRIPYAMQKFNLFDGKGIGDKLLNIGPREFLSAIKYADFIFTDSFHGIVFSILYNKQFVAFERGKNGKVSMNSRLYDLLEMFELKERLVASVNIEYIKKLNDIDYEYVNSLLCAKRKDSYSFLYDAIRI